MFVRLSPESYDAQIMFQVTTNLVLHGSLRVTHDYLGLNTPYSSYGIGMSLAMVPLYLVGRILGVNPAGTAMMVNPVIFALIATTMTLWGRLREASWLQSLGAAALVAIGTPLLPEVATGFSELGVAFGVALGLVAIEGVRQERRWGPLAAGFAAGVSLLMRTDSALLVLPVLAVGVWIASRHRSTDAVRVAAAFAPFGIVWAAYDVLRFGAPWRLGYPGQPFNHPFLLGLYGLVASPSRGLLIYAPLVVVAVWGARIAWRRDRLMAGCGATLLALRILFYSPWWAWYGGGGWGPRLLVPAMPVLFIGVLELVRSWPRLVFVARAFVGVVATMSVIVQVIGASVDAQAAALNSALGRLLAGPNVPILQKVATPSGERRIDAVLFGIRYFPITDEGSRLLHGRSLAGRFLSPQVDWLALTILMAVAAAGTTLLVRTARAADSRAQQLDPIPA